MHAAHCGGRRVGPRRRGWLKVTPHLTLNSRESVQQLPLGGRVAGCARGIHTDKVSIPPLGIWPQSVTVEGTEPRSARRAPPARRQRLAFTQSVRSLHAPFTRSADAQEQPARQWERLRPAAPSRRDPIATSRSQHACAWGPGHAQLPTDEQDNPCRLSAPTHAPRVRNICRRRRRCSFLAPLPDAPGLVQPIRASPRRPQRRRSRSSCGPQARLIRPMWAGHGGPCSRA